MTLGLLISSLLLGFGLAMDAFSVSLANGLNEHRMGTGRMCEIAGTFGIFQFAMPMIGWVCVHTIAEKFIAFQKYIPWIALLLLLYIGGQMLLEGIEDNWERKNAAAEDVEHMPEKRLPLAELMIQGVATSIDALSVGFTISNYTTVMALIATVIIGVETYIICMGGLSLGKKFGTRLAGRASILGGIVLIGIGLEIFITGVFL